MVKSNEFTAVIFPFKGEKEIMGKVWADSAVSADFLNAQIHPSTQTIIGVCGESKSAAAAYTASILSRFSVKKAYLIGTGAALTPNAPDIIIGDSCVELDYFKMNGKGMPFFNYSENLADALWEKVNRSFSVARGPILCGDRDMEDTAERQKLAEQFGAQAFAREGSGFVRACRLHEVDCLEIRLLVDYLEVRSLQDFKSQMTQLYETHQGFFQSLSQLSA